MRRITVSTLLPILIAIAAIGYFLPWVITPTTSLSLGAYDLAEWASLHPAVRATVPFLWTALALRIPLAILGILLATYIHKSLRQTSVAILCIIVTAVAVLPPLEFFTIYRDDPNYRQQFTIALLTVIIGFITLFGRSSKLKTGLFFALSIIGFLSSTAGLYEAQALIRGFAIPTTIGLGGLMTALAFAGAAVFYITKQSS